LLVKVSAEFIRVSACRAGRGGEQACGNES